MGNFCFCLWGIMQSHFCHLFLLLQPGRSNERPKWDDFLPSGKNEMVTFLSGDKGRIPFAFCLCLLCCLHNRSGQDQEPDHDSCPIILRSLYCTVILIILRCLIFSHHGGSYLLSIKLVGLPIKSMSADDPVTLPLTQRGLTIRQIAPL